MIRDQWHNSEQNISPVPVCSSVDCGEPKMPRLIYKVAVRGCGCTCGWVFVYVIYY